MPGEYREEDRFLFFQTQSRGPRQLLLDSYTGHEAISELFSFQLELQCEIAGYKFDAILGSGVSFGVSGRGGGEKRLIHGIVTAFSELPRRGRLFRYRATVSPEVWKLTRKRQSRIFQHKTVIEILQTVLAGYGVEYQTQGSYHPREYCVQYRESDFDFISRLMEEEGICYYFKHEESSHKLVLADTSSTHTEIPGNSRIEYDESEEGTRFEQRIFDWQKTQHWDSGKSTLWDFCFQLPHNNLDASKDILPNAQVGAVKHSLSLGGNGAAMEVYDYPGGYAKHFESGPKGGVSKIFEENQPAAKLVMERVETAQFLIRGQSDVHTLTPGYRFTLDRHFNGDGLYLVTSVTHSAAEGSFYSEGEGAPSSEFTNIFTCIPASMPYRPQCTTAKPQVRGCQTAYVVGPSGEEIFTDIYGRIKVQFHWDREGTNNEDSSCWVRVASHWAGKQWGAIHLPRIGQEVVVDFLEGDPDQPIVVGSVYNAENMPPYSLPDNKTQSTLKSRSSMGGGADNFNEIRFEDKKGSEEVYFQAEKDLKSLIKNDETRDVKHDRTVKVEHDDTKTVTHDLTLTVNHDRTATIANNDSETIGKDQTRSVGGNSTSTVARNNSETVGGSETVSIASSQTMTIGASESHTTGASRSTTIAASDSTTVGASVTITAGGGVTITSGGPISITAPMVSISAAMVQCAGVVQCTTLIAAAGVVSPMYSPGAGNIL